MIDTNYTGIVFHRDRVQQYTVWVGGKVVLFTGSSTLADEVLAAKQQRVKGAK